MTKSEQTRLSNLSLKQADEKLNPREEKEIKRLLAMKMAENPPAKRSGKKKR
jgi:hypothetical protein